MQVVWVQHWSYLPVIVEDIDMSDGRQPEGRLPSSQLPSDSAFRPNEHDRSLTVCMSATFCKHCDIFSHLTEIAAKAHNNISLQPFPTQGLGPQTLLKAGLMTNMSGQQASPQGQGQEQAAGAFNMSGFCEALPDYLHPQDEVERSASGSSATLHQQSPSPFAGQTPMTSPGYSVYPPQYATPYQQAAANAQAYSLSQMNQPSQSTGPNPINPSYPGHAYYPNQQQQQYLLYPGQFRQAGPSQQALPASFAQQFPRGSNPPFGASPLPQHVPDVAGIPGRVSQYGGFVPNGPLNYGYGTGAGFPRPGVMLGSVGP